MYPSTAYSTVAALELYHPPEIRAKTPLQNVTVTTCYYLCTLQQKTPTTAASVMYLSLKKPKHSQIVLHHVT